MLFFTVGENLISMYLQGEGTTQQIADTLKYGKQYLDIMLLGLPPFMMVQIYSSTLRECGETVLPMKAGVVAICVNPVSYTHLQQLSHLQVLSTHRNWLARSLMK